MERGLRFAVTCFLISVARGWRNARLARFNSVAAEANAPGRGRQVARRSASSAFCACGSPSAFYRIATIYGRGRGICNDRILAYAYARVAVDYGELGASKYLHELEAEISREDLARALQARIDIVKDIKVPL